jgi:replicative DNA helicase
MEFQNEEIEKQVLSAIMLFDDERLEAFNILPSIEVFQVDKNKVIAKAIQAQHDAGESINLETLAVTLKKSNLINEAGGVRYLTSIFTSLKHPGHIEIHCRILVEQYLKMKTYFIAQDLLAGSTSDAIDIFEHLAKIQLQSDNLLASTINQTEENFKKALFETSENWFNRPTGTVGGYSTGIESLDKLCGGFNAGELTIIGARPGQGKTALVVSIMRNLAKQNIPCGLFSLEMTKSELIQRLASQESEVYAYKIKQNELNNLDKDSLKRAVDRMADWNLKISEDGYLNIRKLRTKATMWKNKFGIKIIFLDYLQLMESVNPKETNRVNIIGEISRGLKLLAKELQIPVIALSQLSRRVDERQDKMPMMSDLRESGSIEQDADVIWMMLRPEFYYEASSTTKIGDREYPNENLCIIDQVKMRSGSTGIKPLYFDGPLMRLRNYE